MHGVQLPEMSMTIPKEDYDRIAREIESETSPVGIDAKKTHIMILHRLAEIEKRLARLETKLPR